jgi:biotin-(acetyl-CoA carboxylase) ligase
MTEQLEKEYLERLYMAGVSSLFKAGEEQFEATIRGVNDFGELLVECEGEIRTYGHGAIGMVLNL